MKFDVCLMNPPYYRGIYLKFFRILNSVSSLTISINPIQFLKDVGAKDKIRCTLKRFEDVVKHIKDVDIHKFNNYFDICSFDHIGILTLTDKESDFNYNDSWKMFKSDIEISIIEKVCLQNKTKHLSDVASLILDDSICVPLSELAGGRGNLPVFSRYNLIENYKINGENWVDIWNNDPHHKIFQKSENDKICNIKFNTKNEAINFYKSYKELKFFKVICDITALPPRIQFNLLPFLNDYNNEITSQYLYEYFELTPDEINYIENEC